MLAAELIDASSGGTTSLTKKFHIFRASRRAVCGCLASALMKSMPSCMPALAARAGIVWLPFE